MQNPIKVVDTYFRFPYCKEYESYSFEEVKEHMKKCNYNTELPERSCSTCKFRGHIYAKQSCGHSYGLRPLCKVVRRTCKKHLMSDIHVGYNACFGYERG